MRQHKHALNRLARRLDELARQDADGFAPIPYRVYELGADGQRVFVEPDEGDLALDEWARRLVRGGLSQPIPSLSLSSPCGSGGTTAKSV